MPKEELPRHDVVVIPEGEAPADHDVQQHAQGPDTRWLPNGRGSSQGRSTWVGCTRVFLGETGGAVQAQARHAPAGTLSPRPLPPPSPA